MSQRALEALKAKFPGEVVETHNHAGDDTAVVRRDRIIDVLTFLRDDPACDFKMLIDLCGVDYLDLPELAPAGQRYAVVYHLWSFTQKQRLRVKVGLPEDDSHIPTAAHLWKIADWFERETWDMYGVRFDGHPDLRRILMYEEFEGHPLRKDYPVDGRQPRMGPIN